jgi:magnesium-protoporphyrin O-methyltransferase
MNCCQCEGIEQVFDEKHVEERLRAYRRSGPQKGTRLLVEALQKAGVEGKTLLDIGGGIGAIQHLLLKAGAREAITVEASTASLVAAKREAQAQQLDGRIRYYQGDFTDLEEQIPAADIVTLDRVLCCYHDMPTLVSSSIAHARELYGLVYPHDNWWLRAGVRLMNFTFWLRRIPFRGYIHSSETVDTLIRQRGFTRLASTGTLIWQIVVYRRTEDGRPPPHS